MIDNFADNLCQKIEYRKYRKLIKNEILDHLYLTKDNYLKMNYDDAEAEDKAIADFGDPDEIIEDFNHIYKKPGFLYRLLQLSAIAMFLFLVVSFNNASVRRENKY